MNSSAMVTAREHVQAAHIITDNMLNEVSKYLHYPSVVGEAARQIEVSCRGIQERLRLALVAIERGMR